ncbi:MAG: DUF4783 domain-containing protein [Saprospiraceae bacterium]|nr:DUF4783 domain-containing protein [Saprospiraceae bacterium]
MKNVLLILLFAPLMAWTDQGNPGLESIKRAIGAGDVPALSSYFADNVEISIAGSERLYPKAKAGEVVRGFFNTNKPSGFKQVHQGASRESSDQYCIGNLTTENGTYRVYIYLKNSGDEVNIQELRFDKG